MIIGQSQDAADDPYSAPQSDVVRAAKTASPDSAGLPPIFVKFWSFIFSWFILTPLLLFTDDRIMVSFLAFQFTTNRDPPMWVLVLSGLLVLGAISGLAILFRFKAAYDIACIYCICTIACAVISTSLSPSAR